MPENVSTWDSQGCAVCRRQWETAERPRIIAENASDHSALYQCALCATLWLLTERAAVAVGPDDIRSTYPDVDIGVAQPFTAKARGSLNPQLLSDGVVAYLGWGGSTHPRSDDDAAAEVAARGNVDQSMLLQAIHDAIAVSENLPVEVIEMPTAEAASNYKASLRLRCPDLRDDAVDALTSRAFWLVMWGGGSSRREPSPQSAPAPSPHSRTDSTPRVSDDGAQYWRRSVASTDRYFKLVKGQDYILEGDRWLPHNRYKSGPSWWRLTGEPSADIIEATDLPPNAPT